MIWRRLLVQEEMTLFGLHRAIQIVFGWEDYHLHAFKLHGRNYGTIRTGERHRNAAGREIRLGDLQLRVRQRILYEYDFGDLWEHEIRVEAILGRDAGKVYPICIGGARAGPPEDIGGPMGYYALLDQPPADYYGSVCDEDAGDDGDGLLNYDPERFDRRKVNAELKRELSTS